MGYCIALMYLQLIDLELIFNQKPALNRVLAKTGSTVFLLSSLLTFNDVVPHDCDVIIPVGTRLFMVEAQSVT